MVQGEPNTCGMLPSLGSQTAELARFGIVKESVPFTAFQEEGDQPIVRRYQYKTEDIKLEGMGLFGPKKAEGFSSLLNREGDAGWRYVDTILQTGAYGEASKWTIVFEREVQD